MLSVGPRNREIRDDAQTALRDEYETLLQRSYHRAYSAAYRMMGNSSDAEDLTQEAFVRVWAAFDRYDRTRSFEGWLFRILSNLAIDRWRRGASANTCSLDAESSSSRSLATLRGRPQGGSRDGSSSTLLSCLADERPSVMPEQSLFRSEVGRKVRTALEALPCDYRKAVLLADVQGYSYEEIANHVGCPVGTIRSRLHRGRQLLRRNLQLLQSSEEEAEAGERQFERDGVSTPMRLHLFATVESI